MDKPQTITLHGGPCNKAQVEDHKQDLVRISIASPYDTKNDKPMPDAMQGTAIYEVDTEKSVAYFLDNHWHNSPRSL
jgi:hypothetical protein